MFEKLIKQECKIFTQQLKVTTLESKTYPNGKVYKKSINQRCLESLPKEHMCIVCKDYAILQDAEKILAEKVEEFYDFLEKQMDYSLKNKWTSTACILDLVSNEINKIFKSEAKQ